MNGQRRRYRRGWLRVPRESSGSIGRPCLASAEKGARLYERIRSRVAERVIGLPTTVWDASVAGERPSREEGGTDPAASGVDLSGGSAVG